MRREFTIAEKEFRDHLSSKRFLTIIAILMLLALYGVSTGMDSYNAGLEAYKSQQVAGNATSGYQSGTSSYVHVPSILDVFQSMITIFSFLGMILGVAMGFDQISREKEEGSLKLLVTCPMYRDAIINGKALGAVVTLAFAMAATFLLCMAVVMFKSVVPGFDDLLRISVFFLAALLYSILFYAIGALASVFTKNTSASVLYAVGIMVALIVFSLLASIVAAPFAQTIVGPAPPTTGETTTATSSAINTDYTNYTIKLATTENQVSDTLTAFSPFDDFGGRLGEGTGGIGKAILSKSKVEDYSQAGGQHYVEIPLLDSLASVWTKLLVLLVEMVVAFALSYLAFMRMDV